MDGIRYTCAFPHQAILSIAVSGEGVILIAEVGRRWMRLTGKIIWYWLSKRHPTLIRQAVPVLGNCVPVDSQSHQRVYSPAIDQFLVPKLLSQGELNKLCDPRIRPILHLIPHISTVNMNREVH